MKIFFKQYIITLFFLRGIGPCKNKFQSQKEKTIFDGINNLKIN